jgi:hypothetical protein
MRCWKRAADVLYVTLTLVAMSSHPASAEVWRRPLWVEHRLPIVDVWIGSRGPYRFVLDTGAEGTTVSRELATKLVLPLLGAVEQHTVNGAEAALGARRRPSARSRGSRCR